MALKLNEDEVKKLAGCLKHILARIHNLTISGKARDTAEVVVAKWILKRYTRNSYKTRIER